ARHPDAPGGPRAPRGPQQPHRLDAVQRQPRPPLLQGRPAGRFVRRERRRVRLNQRSEDREQRTVTRPLPSVLYLLSSVLSSMNDLTSRIVTAVTRPSYTPVRAKVLARRMGITDDAYPAFRQTLREMIRE